ncbi:hypothetical protein ACJZ2D_009649 [Fusarium nematophilum]
MANYSQQDVVPGHCGSGTWEKRYDSRPRTDRQTKPLAGGHAILACRCGFSSVPFEHCLPQRPYLYDIVAQSADAEKLALVDVHGNLLFWKRNEGTMPLELPEHLGCSSAGAFFESVFVSADGQFVAGISRQHCVYLWQTNAGKILGETDLHEHAFPNYHTHCFFLVSFPRSNWLAIASHLGLMSLWNPTTNEIRSLPLNSRKPEGIHSMAISPDERRLALGVSHHVLLFDLEAGKLYQTYRVPTNRIQFTSDSVLMTSGGALALDSDTYSEGVVKERNAGFLGWGLSSDRSWITWGGRRVLFLPFESHAFSNKTSSYIEES